MLLSTSLSPFSYHIYKFSHHVNEGGYDGYAHCKNGQFATKLQLWCDTPTACIVGYWRWILREIAYAYDFQHSGENALVNSALFHNFVKGSTVSLDSTSDTGFIGVNHVLNCLGSMFCWMKFRQLFHTDMCFSCNIYRDWISNRSRLFKRDYKDEEKKVIKNKICYCFLILFYMHINYFGSFY